MSGLTNVLTPMFIKAPSLEGLQKQMYDVNALYKKSFDYDWKYTNKKDGYVALYYLDASDLKVLARLKSKVKEN